MINKWIYQRAFENVRFVVAGRKVYRLSRDERGLWKDKYGVIWALHDTHASIDDFSGCGISPFALPNWHIFKHLNEICAAHDYMYSSPAYQYFNTRKDADDYLEMLIRQSPTLSIAAKPFKILTRLLGWMFWDSKKN
jgi:hypothetical protein